MGGDGPGLVDHLLGGHVDRRAADRQRPGPVGVQAGGADRGVGVQDLHVVGVDAELVGHDHRPARLVALAVGRGAGHHLNLAGGRDPNRGRLPAARAVVERRQHPAGGQTAHLHIAGEADADALRRARGPPLGRLGPAPVDVGQRDRLVEHGLVVAAVEDQPGRRLVREGVGTDEVAGPDLLGRHPHRHGQRVHGPLHRVGGLGTARAPVGVGRGPVGEHRRALEHVVRDVVAAVVQEPAQQRHARRDQLQVGAHVGQQLDPHRRHLAVGVGGQLDVLDLAAALDGGHRGLGPALGPAHRRTPLHRQGAAEDLLGVDVELAAEAAAHRRGHHPQLVLGDAQHDCGHHLEDVRDLGGGVQRELAAGRRRHRRAAPGLHRRRDQALLQVALAHHMGGLRESGVDGGSVIAPEAPRVALVGLEVGVDQRRTVGHRVLYLDHRGQRLVVDDDRGRAVGGGVAGVGQDHRHRVAHVLGRAAGYRQMRRVLHVGGDRPGARQGALAPQRGQVLAGQHLVHAVDL